jgi:hypothetical protein
MAVTSCRSCGDYDRCRPAGTDCPGCDQDVHERPHAPRRLRQYVAVASFPPDQDSGEELDLWASTEHEARAVAEAALDRDYEPGGHIVALGHPHEVGGAWVTRL